MAGTHPFFLFLFSFSSNANHSIAFSAPFGPEPSPVSVLINGKGYFNCSYVEPGKSCVPNTQKTTFVVDSGKRYRLRILNVGAVTNFHFSIDQHRFVVIEADGTDTAIGAPVDSIHINAGERYSVIVQADQPIANYWIRCNIIIPDLDEDPLVDLNPEGLAIFRYNGSTLSDPSTSPSVIEYSRILWT